MLGIDNHNDYYDVNLKEARLARHINHENYTHVRMDIEIIAAYETLSETHWNAPHIEPNFTPNWVIDITDHIEEKLKALQCYKSQIFEFPNPRSIEAVEGLAKFRGTQAGFGFGEGMHIIRKIS